MSEASSTNPQPDTGSGKVCFKCKLYKEASEFYRDPRGSKGLYSMCKKCQIAYTTARLNAHPGLATQYLGRGRYNIDFDAMWAAQNGLCALCDLPMVRGGRKYDSVCVDHDHECCSGYKSCGKCVRGLIHRRCNFVLGYAEDAPDRIRQAIEYLQSFKVPRG
jgi:hypothetical protein